MLYFNEEWALWKTQKNANKILKCLFLMWCSLWLDCLTENFLYIEKHLHMGNLSCLVWWGCLPSVFQQNCGMFYCSKVLALSKTNPDYIPCQESFSPTQWEKLKYSNFDVKPFYYCWKWMAAEWKPLELRLSWSFCCTYTALVSYSSEIQ